MTLLTEPISYKLLIPTRRREFAPDHHHERDVLVVSGKLRGKTRRRFTHGEVHLLPSFVSRNELSDEVDRIGNAWVESGKLCASAWIPADAYFSLPYTFASVTFAEMTMRVRNLRYNRGTLDAISFSHKLTPLEEDD